MSSVLWISGEIQADVGDNFRAASNDVEDTVNASLGGNDYGAQFSRLSLIPIIRLTDSPIYKEVRRYHKKDRDFEFRLKISHAAFKAADPIGQRRLIVENILRAVSEMRTMRVKDVDHDKLERDIRAVAVSKGWLPASPDKSSSQSS